MKNLYRKGALERIASMDQLDKVLKVTSPLSWLALFGVTVILAVTVVWSIVGSLPLTVTAAGIIVNANSSTNTVTATQHGTVQRIIGIGAEVYSDTMVVEFSTGDGSLHYLPAGQVGTVSEILVKPGDTLENGTEVLRLTPKMTMGQKHLAVCYVMVSDADKIRRDMPAHITLTAANASIYGYIEGRVVNVDTALATSQKAIGAVAGNDNSMFNALTDNGKAVVAVACELYPDPHSVSGYHWSNEKGRTKEVTAPQMCSVKIITENVAPITKLFAKLKDIWENR